MGQGRVLAVTVIVCLGLFLGGCGVQQQPSTGAVYGLISDAVGHPVAGASVSLGETGIRTYSSSDGTFSFQQVPAGTQVLTVTKDGYSAVKLRKSEPFRLQVNDDGTASLQSGETNFSLMDGLARFTASRDASKGVQATVNVPQGGSVEVQFALAANSSHQTDNVWAYYAQPEPGSELKDEAFVEIRVDCSYSMQSEAAGKLIFLLVNKTNYRTQVLASAEQAVSNGRRSHPFTLSLTPYAVAAITPMLAITDTDDNLLAYMLLPDYPIDIYNYKAPILTVTNADIHGVQLSWLPRGRGNVSGYTIMRDTRWLGRALDATQTTFTDAWPLEGREVTYSVEVNYTDYGSLTSAPVKVTAPRTETVVIPFGDKVTDLILDPVRDYIYTLSPAENKVLQISRSTKALQNELSVCSMPSDAAISGDGQVLVVACSGGDAVAVVDPESFLVQDVISGLSGPLAVATDGEYLFVANRQDELLMLNLSSGAELRKVKVLSPVDLQLSPDGTLLYLRSHYNNLFTVFNATDLSQADQGNVDADALFAFNSSGTKFYVGSYVYSAIPPCLWQDALQFSVLAADKNGKYLLGRIYKDQASYITVMKYNGFSWESVDRWYDGLTQVIAAVANDTEVFILGRSNAVPGEAQLLIVDLAARQSVR